MALVNAYILHKPRLEPCIICLNLISFSELIDWIEERRKEELLYNRQSLTSILAVLPNNLLWPRHNLHMLFHSLGYSDAFSFLFWKKSCSPLLWI